MEYQIRLFRSDEIECIIGNAGCLGGGSYGVVRLAFHRIHGTVAVKCSVMRGGMRTMNQLEKKIKKEIEMIQRAHHENIVRVYGWTQWSGAIAIIMEHLPGGNLLEVLLDDDVILEPLLRLKMCYETSNGIAFIHNFSPNKRLVHGDLKPENILLTEGLQCKLADFGGARLSAYTGGTTATNRRQHTNQFTEIYASPEILEDPTVEMKPPHDTYSFSVITFVLLGRKLPILSDLLINIYLEKVRNGKRPDLASINDFIRELEEEGRSTEAGVITDMKELMVECWQQNPSDRPLMVDVKNGLYESLARHDAIQIQQHAVDAAREMDIQKPSRGQHRCVPLHRFSAPDFEFIGDSSNASHVTSSSMTRAPDASTSASTLGTNIAGSSKLKGFLATNKEKVFFYDVTNRTLQQLKNMKFNHSDGSAVTHKDECYVIGGQNNGNSVERLNLQDMTSNWMEVASLNESRWSAASCVCGEYIYTVGGEGGWLLLRWSIWSTLTSGEFYDHRDNRWRYIKNMNERRRYHALVCVKDKLYAIGGYNGRQRLKSMESYNPIIAEWTSLPSMRTRRLGVAAVTLNEEIYVIGGCDGKDVLASVERFIPHKAAWDEIAPLNHARVWHSACVVNNKIYVVGGGSGAVEVYDTSKNIWNVESTFEELKWIDCIVAV